MSGNFRKEDLRVIKTHKALTVAMNTLLNRRNFEKITVNDLCQEALVSRAAFYAHFNDKYDLLRYYMTIISGDIIRDVYRYAEVERTVNTFVGDNPKMIINLVQNANNEVTGLLHDFMYGIIDVAVKKNNGQPNLNQILLLNFCAGGMVSLLKWQVQNKFPEESPMINLYLYKMIECITQWDAKQA